MHDIRAIRAEPQAFDAGMARRGLSPQSEMILALDASRRATLSLLQEKQAKRNELSRDIGRAKREGVDTASLELTAVTLRSEMELLQGQADQADADIKAALESLPNLLADDVPEGADETANLQLKVWGEVPRFDFAPRQHFELGEALGMMDFAAAAKLAGARFTVLRGALARMERALGQFMIDLHTAEHGYEEMIVPTLVNDAAVYGTSQLPKFAEDLFRTTDGRWLIPTAEVPLTNMAAGEITPEARLPWRMTALTDCFRSEAGSAGRDTRGMLRQHQFRKVEMVSITTPEQSAEEHERMTRAAETVLERLGLPYRRMLLCAGDTGFGATKTFDLEVWLPGQEAWREISSCSNMRDFQARRMNARTRGADGKSAGFAHTLNGSGLAVGRTLIAVMENCQQPDGTIRVPEALRPYMGGVDVIAAA
ncbi:MAG TPA: serine--tRNA ligase [Acidisoma sp.]|jgi:seryl-tRNA synthetase|uniref:serine--tRNA ligase n=1 Tax=Acidisoma sp. TaxID=1872115 RepID=UPI002B950FB6|nr:serine--tRNA ligase [Acidisoma sp.]HTI00660.1 serine--tRNA ligase [Acidisoma sp.]